MYINNYTVEPPLMTTSEEQPLSTKRPVAQVRIEFTITYTLSVSDSDREAPTSLFCTTSVFLFADWISHVQNYLNITAK